jgi:hypothetical protein
MIVTSAAMFGSLCIMLSLVYQHLVVAVVVVEVVEVVALVKGQQIMKLR